MKKLFSILALTLMIIVTGSKKDPFKTNSSGFNAIPSGYLADGAFQELAISAVYWTATGAEAETAFDRYMDNVSDGIDRGAWPRSDGYSVRCVRN